MEAEVLLGALAVPAGVGPLAPPHLLPPPLSRGDGGRDHEGEHEAATTEYWREHFIMRILPDEHDRGDAVEKNLGVEQNLVSTSLRVGVGVVRLVHTI